MVNQHDHVKPFQEKENFERRQFKSRRVVARTLWTAKSDLVNNDS